MLAKINRRKTNTAAALLSIAVVVIYMLNLGFENSSNTPQQIFKHNQHADRSGLNFDIKQYDPQGLLSYHLVSKQLDYFEPSKVIHQTDALQVNVLDNTEDFSQPFDPATPSMTRITQPLITVFSGLHRTKITADMATLLDTEQIELKGNVSVYESQNNNLLTTNILHLNTQLKQIMTQQAVNISSPYSRTTATGLQGNIADQRWQLLSEVRSEIMPQ